MPQPLLGLVLGSLGLGTVAAGWLLAAQPIHRSTALMAAVLLAALVLSYRFPIHIRLSSKLYMGSATLYLLAILLPPPLAATIAILGVTAGELSVRGQTGNYLSDIAAHAGRWGALVLAASLAGRWPWGSHGLSVLALLLPAAILWAGDILTAIIIYVPLTGERPRHIAFAMIQDAGIAEAAQYLIGLTAAIEVEERGWTLFLFVLPLALVYAAFKSSKEMHVETRTILESMADTVDMRDPYTGGHSRRVTDYTRRLLHAMEKHGPEADLIISAARVHDIGKIGIPDEVLLKPDRLTPEERAIMETHPARGAELLQRYPDFVRGVAIIRHHHEAWDGSGYPDGLARADIPFGARVIAVADSFDAMTSDRPYRKGMSTEKAASILREGRGRQWDPQAVDAFLRALGQDVVLPAPAAMPPVPDAEANPAGHRLGA